MPGDLDGILYCLGARVEQGGPLVMIAWRYPVELFADRHVTLVRGDHEAGMGELSHLLGDPLHDQLGTIAYRGDGNPGPEVDQRVPVRVDEHAAPRGGHELREHMAEPAGDAALPPVQQHPRGG